MSNKLPFFQFFPLDWLADTAILSNEAKGAYIDVLCQLWLSGTPGKRYWFKREFTNMLRLFEHEHDVEGPIRELAAVCEIYFLDADDKTCDFENCVKVLVKSRRMMRDWKRLTQRQIRNKKYYDKIKTELRPHSDDKKSEVRSQKSDSLERKKDRTSIETHEQIHERRLKKANEPFPPDWVWLKIWVERQVSPFPVEKFLDWSWWDNLSESCGGLDEELLNEQSARWRRWIMDNPQRAPTPKGYRRFVASWLERNYERERRFSNGKKA